MNKVLFMWCPNIFAHDCSCVYEVCLTALCIYLITKSETGAAMHQKSCKVFGEDRCRTVDEIECYFKEVECSPLSHGTIMKIIHEELVMSKVCAWWEPKLLMDVPRASQMAALIEFLMLRYQEGKICLHESGWVMENKCIITPLRWSRQQWCGNERKNRRRQKQSENSWRAKFIWLHFGMRKACYWRNTQRMVRVWTKKPTSVRSSD